LAEIGQECANEQTKRGEDLTDNNPELSFSVVEESVLFDQWGLK
jgi:hypothetical protein